MKKVLFLIPTFGSGGAEKSFVSLLQNIDYNKFSVDVCALRPVGLTAEMIPPQVNVLPLPPKYGFFAQELPPAVSQLIKKGDFPTAFKRIMYSAVLRKYSFTNVAEQKSFKYLKDAFKGFYSHYDAAVSYLEKTTNYIVSQCIDADIKIGYIHSSYDKLELDAQLDSELMKNLDRLVTVSDACADILRTSLPAFSDRVSVIENIICKPIIIKQAAEYNPYSDFDGTRIVTVGRLSREKGPDIALEACRLLCQAGYSIKWHMVGSVDTPQLIKQAKELSLEDKFIFEGVQKNPYVYIYNSDIYVQPSRYEGKSIAIEEAKVLGVPIVLSGFDTASSQITNRENGLIAKEISPAAVAESIAELIDSRELYNSIRKNLAKEEGNTDEIKKFERLIQ